MDPKFIHLGDHIINFTLVTHTIMHGEPQNGTGCLDVFTIGGTQLSFPANTPEGKALWDWLKSHAQDITTPPRVTTFPAPWQ